MKTFDQTETDSLGCIELNSKIAVKTKVSAPSCLYESACKFMFS